MFKSTCRCAPVVVFGGAIGSAATLLSVGSAWSMIFPFDLRSGRDRHRLRPRHISFGVAPEELVALRGAEEVRPAAMVFLGCCFLYIDLHAADGVGYSHRSLILALKSFNERPCLRCEILHRHREPPP